MFGKVTDIRSTAFGLLVITALLLFLLGMTVIRALFWPAMALNTIAAGIFWYRILEGLRARWWKQDRP